MNKICTVCEKESAKYKCPRCRTPYCSISCCKEHKQVVCEPPLPPASLSSPAPELAPAPVQAENNTEEDADNYTIPLEILQRISESQEVRNCLENPQVRDIITFIANNNDPMKALNLGMTESCFADFASACLNIVEPEDQNDC